MPDAKDVSNKVSLALETRPSGFANLVDPVRTVLMVFFAQMVAHDLSNANIVTHNGTYVVKALF